VAGGDDHAVMIGAGGYVASQGAKQTFFDHLMKS